MMKTILSKSVRILPESVSGLTGTSTTIMMKSHPAFHIMVKPVGPLCNLACKYCFYLEKDRLFPPTEKWTMTPEILETFIREYIRSQPTPVVSFAWQGGEPTLAGLDFFRQVIRLQKKYSHGKRIENAFQTNGILLDDCWCEFLSENRFLVGLSIDGPQESHDKYRLSPEKRSITMAPD